VLTVLNTTELEALLYHLCVEYGFCLQPNEYAKLCADPPAEVTGFTDAVYRAEGLDPAATNQRVYRMVHAAVERAFRGVRPEGTGRGAPPNHSDAPDTGRDIG